MRKVITKKSYASLGLLFLSIFLIGATPEPAYAQFAVSVVKATPGDEIAGVNAVANKGSFIKDIVGDPLAYAVSRVVISTITKSTVNWINSGFSGSPAFVQDLQSEFLRIGDTVATRYIDEFLQNDSISNNPFRDEIGQAVLSGYFGATGRDGFYLKNPYTLGEYSSDPRAFINGDYSKGGLNAWRELIFNPGNNPVLLRDAVSEELHNRIGSAVDTRNKELAFNNGFNSYRGSCGKNSSPSGTSAPSPTGTKSPAPGATPLAAPGLTPTFDPAKLAADTDAQLAKDFGPNGLITQKNAATLAKTGYKQPFSLVNLDFCLGKAILTPGSLISQSANKFLVNNGLDQLIQADEVNEIVNALVGQLVNQVLGSGGLAGTTRPSSGGRSYIDRLGDPKGSTSASASLDLSNTFLTTIAKQALALQQYQDNWQKIADAAAAAKKAFPNSVCTAQANAILAQAGSAVSDATSAISAIKKIQNDVTASVSTDPTSQTQTVAKATDAYQALQSSGTIPTIRDITYAQEESVERTANADLGLTTSLYTQMVQLQSTGTCAP